MRNNGDIAGIPHPAKDHQPLTAQYGEQQARPDAPHRHTFLRWMGGDAGAVLNVLYFGLFGLLLLVALHWFVPALRDRSAVLETAALYHSQCPTPSASPGGPPLCPTKEALVVSHYTKGSGHLESLWIVVQPPRGLRYAQSIDDQSVWDATPVGQQVVIQVWHHHMTYLFADGQGIKTHDNPDALAEANSADLLGQGFVVAVASMILLLPVVYKPWANRRFKQPLIITSIIILAGVVLRAMT